MDQEARRVIALMSDHFRLPAVQEWEELSLYPGTPDPRSFSWYLIQRRIRPFMWLHVLNAMPETAIFVVGAGDLKTYEPDDEEFERPLHSGPFLIPRIFTRDELFEDLLGSLGFSAVQARTIPPEELIGEAGPLDDKFLKEYWNQPTGWVYAMLEPNPVLVITESFLYVSDPLLHERLKAILATHIQWYDNLLATTEAGIPHSRYVDILQRWFPGKIRVRSLE